MEGPKILGNFQIGILGICIAVATIISSVILSQGFLKVKKFTEEVIDVTGSAQRGITSDYVAWKGSFSVREVSLPATYKKLNEDLSKVKKYLLSKGVNEKEIVISQISTSTIYKKNAEGESTNEIELYHLNQGVEVCSKDVERVTEVSREITELINEGVEFDSGAPKYFYTKLDDLKVEMLARASENAKLRAENMARATGNKVGLMRSARMGVFQITPINSTEVSNWGVNDTSSLEKKVTAVVTVSFAIE